MKYPTIQQVLKASQEQLRKWYTTLPTAETNEQIDVIALIFKRLCK